MKKKILGLGLTVVLVGGILAGCGSKDATDNKETTTRVESSTEGETSTEEPTTVSDEFKDIDETGVVRGDVTYTVDDFKKAVMTDNFKLTTKSGGLDMTIAAAGGNTRINMSCEVEGVNYALDIYTIGNEMYSSMTNEEGEMVYYHALVEDGDSSAISTDGFAADLESISSVEYVITKKYEGAVYDVLKVGTPVYDLSENVTLEIEGETVDTEAMNYTEYYVNVTTKKVEYAFTEDEATGEKVVGKYEIIDSISLPAEFASADVKDVSAEDIASQMLGMMFLQLSDSDIQKDMHNN